MSNDLEARFKFLLVFLRRRLYALLVDLQQQAQSCSPAGDTVSLHTKNLQAVGCRQQLSEIVRRAGIM